MESFIKTTVIDSPYYPSIYLDYRTGMLEIAGESYMEDTYRFYSPVIEWLINYVKEQKPIIFNFKLNYFNTSTSRFILDILDILKNYKSNGGDVKIYWHYRQDDPDMVDEVKDFEEESGVEIKLEIIRNK